MKAGTRIQVRFIRPEGDVLEAATVRRTTKGQTAPAGWVPVRFVADGAALLVHQSNIVEAA